MAFRWKWSPIAVANGVGLTAFIASVAHRRCSTPSGCPLVRKVNVDDGIDRIGHIERGGDNPNLKPYSKTMERLSELRERDATRQHEDELNTTCAYYGMKKEDLQRVFSPRELEDLKYMSVMYTPDRMTGNTSLHAKQSVRKFMIESMTLQAGNGQVELNALKYAMLMKIGDAHKCNENE
jgi:hypothetical protein